MKNIYRKSINILALLAGLLLAGSLNAQTISTIAGNDTAGFRGDGAIATKAELDGPFDVAIDNSGNIYMADYTNNRVREITASTGFINTIGGNGTSASSGDGTAATAAGIFGPVGLAIDASGNIYIAEQKGNRIRKITVSTGIITTVAGTGSIGLLGDGGQATAASVNTPSGIALDGLGNMYISDNGNNRIRIVTASSGIINTIAGDGATGGLGDGGLATAAQLNNPYGLSVDASGNLYIVDLGNNKVRMVTVATGIITTVAGTGTSGYSGDGIMATASNLNAPSGITLDGSGNMYIGDENSNRVRMVNASTGIISTIAGTGVYGYSGDGGPATAAKLQGPAGLKLDGSGNLIVADFRNNVVRKITNVTGVNELIAHEVVNVYPNPATQTLNIQVAVNGAFAAGITVLDITGKEVMKMNTVISGDKVMPINVSMLANGIYFVKITTDKNTQVVKFVKQ